MYRRHMSAPSRERGWTGTNPYVPPALGQFPSPHPPAGFVARATPPGAGGRGRSLAGLLLTLLGGVLTLLALVAESWVVLTALQGPVPTSGPALVIALVGVPLLVSGLWLLRPPTSR